MNFLLGGGPGMGQVSVSERKFSLEAGSLNFAIPGREGLLSQAGPKT